MEKALALRNIPQNVSRESLLALIEETMKGWRASRGYRVEWIGESQALRFTMLNRPREILVGEVTHDFNVETHSELVSTDRTWTLSSNPDGTFDLRLEGSDKYPTTFVPKSRVGVAGFMVRAWKLCAKEAT